MAYRIIEADSPAELERTVDKAMADGWAIQGAVSVAPIGAVQGVTLPGLGIGGIGYMLRYFQAVIK